MSSKSWLLWVSLGASLIACAADDEEIETTAEAPVEELEPDYEPLAGAMAGDPRRDLPEHDDPSSVESSEGTGRFHPMRVLVDGVEAEVVVEEHADGSLVLDGDMRVGTVADLHARSNYLKDLTKRWPDGKIPFEFDASWHIFNDAAAIVSIRLAMDRIAQHSPIRFSERDGEAAYIKIIKASDSSADVGYTGGVRTVNLAVDAPFGTFIHELLHASGVRHEQQRGDIRDHVDYFDECRRSDFAQGNFTISTDTRDGSRMDWRSVMLYWSGGGCKKDTTDADGDGNTDECSFRNAATGDVCWTLENITDDCPTGADGICWDADGDGVDEAIDAQREMLSANDLNGLFSMYGRALGGNEALDRYGSALAVGDFDGDGYRDLAVGAPTEAPGEDPASGVVYLFKGTHRGLAPWRSISQETRAVNADGTLGADLDNNDSNDKFGAALAVGDFDHDGTQDLAVGAPGETHASGTTGAGAVFIFKGHRNLANDARFGLQPWKQLDQADLASSIEADDRFGEALVAGDFNGDGDHELAIGSPGESFPGQPKGGAVFIVKGGASLTLGQTLGPNMLFVANLDNQRFGTALAAGKIDADGDDDLVVGAPGHPVGSVLSAGGVAFFSGGTSLNGWRWEQASSSDAGANEQMGHSVAIGELNGGGTKEVAVGIPNDGGGRVLVYRLTSAETFPTVWKNLTQTSLGSGDSETGELFGFSVAIGDVDADGNSDLVIGVPRENIGSATNSGQAVVVRGTGSNLVFFDLLEQAGLDDVGSADGFGQRIAFGNVDGDSQLEVFVAAPLEDDGTLADVGSVIMLEHSGGAMVPRRVISQRTTGVDAEAP